MFFMQLQLIEQCLLLTYSPSEFNTGHASYVFFQDGSSALIIASQYGHAEVVDKLLQHGANMDLQNNVSAQYILLSIIPLPSLYLMLLHPIMLILTLCESYIVTKQCIYI